MRSALNDVYPPLVPRGALPSVLAA
jgi:hypothetical protein